MIITVCKNGYGNCVDEQQYRLQTRGQHGVMAIKTSLRNGDVAAVAVVSIKDHLLLTTVKGMGLKIPVSDIRVSGRASQGVKLIDLNQDDYVVGVTVIKRGAC